MGCAPGRSGTVAGCSTADLAIDPPDRHQHVVGRQHYRSRLHPSSIFLIAMAQPRLLVLSESRPWNPPEPLALAASGPSCRAGMEASRNVTVDGGNAWSGRDVGVNRVVLAAIFPDRLCAGIFLRPLPLLAPGKIRTRPRHHQPLRPPLQLSFLQRRLSPRAPRPPRRALARTSPPKEA